MNLALVGGIAILGFLVATVGAAALGLIFAKLGELDPQEGGPYAYARDFRSGVKDVRQIIGELNPVLRGGGNYFRTGKQ